MKIPRNARKISSTFWIGEDPTYGIVGKPVILVNQELKKVRFQVKKVRARTSMELVCVDGRWKGIRIYDEPERRG